MRTLKRVDISVFVHFGIEYPPIREKSKVPAVIDHTYFLFGKAQLVKFPFCIVRMKHLVSLILPLHL